MKLPLITKLSGVALATLGTSSAAQAALMVVPTDLNPGDQYRLVFVTDGAPGAESSNINDYNTFVTNDATGGTPAIDTALDTALSTAGFNPNAITWKAIGSTATVAARDNTGTNPTLATGVPIYLIDGNRVANNNADLWDGSIQTAINRTPLDSSLTGVDVWSGTSANGTLLVGSSPLGSSFPTIGTNSFTDSSWINSSIDDSRFGLPLYSLSEVLTVPVPGGGGVTAVPEPGQLLGCITLGGLMLGGAVRKARK